MRIPRLALGVASIALAATSTGRLAIVVAGAAVTTSCEPCSVGPISPDALPDGQVGKAYFLQLHAPTGGSCSGTRAEFSRVAGDLPPAMKLSKDGALDGTPSQSGAYSFTVTVTLTSTGEYSYPLEGEPKRYTLTILP
jgi:large repetitive protein